MSKSTIKRSLIILCFAIFALFGVLVFSGLEGSAESYVFYADAFDTSLMTVTPNLNKFGSTGLGLTSKYVSAKAKAVNKICGDIETEFSFYDENRSTYLREIEIELKDETGKGFSVVLERQGNEISACVSFGGVKCGLSYSDGGLENNTTADNSKGIYTKIPAADIYGIKYEKDSGNVYLTANEETYLVWCVGSTLNDGRETVVSLFDGAYDLTFKFNKIVFPQEEYGKYETGIILYQINGQSYAGYAVRNIIGPDVYANVDAYAVVGEKYYIPEPQAYDVFDGRIEKIYVEVKTAFATILPKTEYVKGLSFDAESGNNYIIEYSASDKDGKTGYFVKNVPTVERGAAQGGIIFSTDFSSETVGKGSNTFIPNAYAESDSLFSGKNFNVSLKILFNDSELSVYDSLFDIENREFVFENVGTYTFEFSFVSENRPFSETVVFTVTDDLPVFYMDSAINKEYPADTEIYFPEILVTLGSETVSAEKFVEFPSGNKYKVSDKIELTEEGWYSIEYSAVLNGKKCGKIITFKVIKDALKYSDGVSHYISEKDGEEKFVVSYSSVKQSIVTNGVVDLNEFSREESFAEFEFIPSAEGFNDFEWIYVTLTDIDDPDIYAIIRLHCVDDSGVPTYRVYACAMTDSSEKYVGVTENFGTEKELVSGGTWGTRTIIDPTKNGATVKLSFDIETNIVYINFQSGEMPSLPIVDLDSLRYFGTVWGGFTSGKVKISVTVGNIISSRAVFAINKLGKTVSDAYGCDIKILSDYGSYPLAEVGVPYSLFQAKAVTYKGTELPVEVSVSFADNRSVNVATDGKSFTPPVEGTYVVIYSVKKLNGEIYEKEMTVKAVKALPELDLYVYFDGTAYVGEEFFIPIYSVSGAVGIAEVKTFIEFEGTKTELFDTYTPLAEGDYTLIYEISDYNDRTVEKRLPFTCYGNNTPTFITTDFPMNYMLCGKEYELPIMTAYDGGFGKMIDAEISVISDDEETKLNGNTFTPNYQETQDITIRYTAVGKNDTSIMDFTVRAINYNRDGRYVAKDLFFGDGVNVSTGDDGVYLSTEYGGNIRFVNEIIKDVSLTFRINGGEFYEFNIYLTDATDENNVVKVGYERNGDKIIVRINETDRVYYTVSGGFGAGVNLDLVYSDSERILSNNASEFLHTLKLNLNGDEFSGFKGNSVYVDFEFVDVYGDASATIVYINNQSFRNQIDEDGLMGDWSKPQILPATGYGGKKEIGTEYIVPTAAAYDVLSGISSCYVTCTDPSGKYVTSTDGKILQELPSSSEYIFILKDYGQYTVEYRATDENNKTEYFIYVIKVADQEAPDIKLKNELKTIIKAGEKIAIPDVNVTDNVSESGKISVYVNLTDPYGTVRSVKIGETITLNIIGKYSLAYLAYDEANNVAIKFAEIIAK